MALRDPDPVKEICYAYVVKWRRRIFLRRQMTVGSDTNAGALV